MAYLIGIGVALLVSSFASLSGFDRDRALYPTVLVVVASYYVLFAVMGGSRPALLTESAVMLVFAVIAFVGFRFNLWLIALTLAGHGVFDFVHGGVISNPGVPVWWPAFCLAYDLTAAAWLAWLLMRSRLTARPATVGPPLNLNRVER